MLALADRSRHYSPELRAEFNALDWRDAAERAAGWRRNATDTDLGPEWVAHSLAVAAWLQSISDRKRPPATATIPDDVIFCEYHPEQYVDQGGPCGHSSADGMFDDCLCRDGYMIYAHISDGLTPDYCDGEPAGSRLFAREHAQHCEHYRTDPWMPF